VPGGAAKTAVASAIPLDYICEMEQHSRIATVIKRALILVVLAFILFVFGTFAVNFYRNYQSGDPATPGIIFERSDRPSRV
jgi:hypothetical protein